MVMDDVRGKKRRRHHQHTEALTKHELQERLPGLLREAGLPSDEPLEVTHDDEGHITIRRLKSRFDRFIGAAPGLENYLDVESDRDSWAQRDAEIERQWGDR